VNYITADPHKRAVDNRFGLYALLLHVVEYAEGLFNVFGMASNIYQRAEKYLLKVKLT